MHVHAADECAARDREQRPAAIELVTDRRELLLQRPVSGGGTEMRPAPTTQRTSTNDRRALIGDSFLVVTSTLYRANLHPGRRATSAITAL
jgi:hypothetical protein